MSLTIAYLSQLRDTSSFLLLGPNPAMVHIMDAHTLWVKSGAILFHTGFRLAGTLENLKIALGVLGVSGEQATAVLNSCLTRTNYRTTYKNIYQEEVTSYEKFMDSFLSKYEGPGDLLPMGTFQDDDMEKFVDITGNVDVFNFANYPEDYNLFAMFFSGVELWIRLSNWIIYKYIRLTTDDERLELQTETMAKPDIKTWLEDLTNIFEGEQLVYSWYKHFKPKLLWNVPNLYEKWQHHLGHFINKLYKRYVDPNHQEVELWF